MEQDTKGRFIDMEMDNGVRCSVYVPQNVNANTPIFTYVHGSGGPTGNWRTVKEAVAANGSNSVIIMPTMAWNSDWGKETMNVVNAVKQQYGITNSNVSSGGFSFGGFSGYTTLAANLRQNPDADPQIGYFIDDYSNLTYKGYKQAVADQETMDLFRENNSVFFIMENASKDKSATNAFAQSGINVIRVVCERGEHSTINKDFFNNGMYDYMAGGELPKEHYRYQKYNQATGQWEDIPYESIATIDSLYDYYGLDSSKINLDKLYSLADIKIKSDDKTLENHLNSIRGTIRNAKFLTMNYTNASFSSTTQIPQRIPDAITAYFDNTAALLNSIARKTVAIAKIAGEISYLDQSLANRTVQLNNAEPLYKTATPLPNDGAVELVDLSNTTDTQDTTNLSNATNLSNTQTPNNQNNQFVGQTSPSNQNFESNLPNYSNLSNQSYQPTSSSSNIGGTSSQQPTISSPISGGTSSQQPSINSSNGSSASPQRPSYQQSPSSVEQTPTVENLDTQQPTTPLKEQKIEETFPKYEELYSNDNQIVYNYNDEYKVIVHHEDNKITAIEHYYDFETTEAATTAIEKLQTEYENIENFDKIIQNDRYVKVLFKEEMYADKTITQIKEKYIELKEVVEKPIEHLEVL